MTFELLHDRVWDKLWELDWLEPHQVYCRKDLGPWECVAKGDRLPKDFLQQLPRNLEWDGTGNLTEVMNKSLRVSVSDSTEVDGHKLNFRGSCQLPLILKVRYTTTEHIPKAFQRSVHFRINAPSRVIDYQLVGVVRLRNSPDEGEFIRLYATSGNLIHARTHIPFESSLWSMSDANTSFMLYFQRLRKPNPPEQSESREVLEDFVGSEFLYDSTKAFEEARAGDHLDFYYE